MPSTTDFELWLAENEPESAEEVEALFNAADGSSFGIYDASKDQSGRVFIKPTTGESTLALLSQAAIDAFKKRVEKFADPELGIHGDAAFQHAMRKDD